MGSVVARVGVRGQRRGMRGRAGKRQLRKMLTDNTGGEQSGDSGEGSERRPNSIHLMARDGKSSLSGVSLPRLVPLFLHLLQAIFFPTLSERDIALRVEVLVPSPVTLLRQC